MDINIVFGYRRLQKFSSLSLENGSHTKAAQWLFGDMGRRKNVLQKGPEENFVGVIKIFYILIVAVVSWVYTFAKTANYML